MSKSEARTRKELIDVNLLKAGWKVSDRTQVIEEFDIVVGMPERVSEAQSKYDGHQFSDYILLAKMEKEAPKSSKGDLWNEDVRPSYCSPLGDGGIFKGVVWTRN